MTLFGFELSVFELGLFILVGLLMGMSKTGVGGVSMIAVPILAILFGGKNSSGIMLIILIIADVFGASYYRRHAQWKHLTRLLPMAFIGVILGTWLGQYINDETFKLLMGIIVFTSIGILIWLEKVKVNHIPQSKAFAAIIGVLLGFTTMVGNLAGAIMTLYLLIMHIPKLKFIGTVAWFFIIINLIKVPFHVFIWKTITWQTLFLDLLLLPPIALGAFLGIKIVRQIPDTSYRYFILIVTCLAAIFMIVETV